MNSLEKTISFTSAAFDFKSELPDSYNFGNKFYGKDVANYFKRKLFEQGFEAEEVEEDWGWQVSGELSGQFGFDISIYCKKEGSVPVGEENCDWDLVVQAYHKKSFLGLLEKLVPVEVPAILDLSIKFAIAQLSQEPIKEEVSKLVSNYLNDEQLKEISKYMKSLIRMQYCKEDAEEITLDMLLDVLPEQFAKDLIVARKIQDKRSKKNSLKVGPDDISFVDFYAEYIANLYEKELADCVLEEKAWPEITDCDKLKTAFEKLDKKGILVKENFSCCQTCGSGEILDHIQEHHYGAAFYHVQDTENAQDIEDGPTGIYLSYGRTGLSSPFSIKEIAEQIIEGIEAEGLRVEWDRNENTRIFIQMKDWKRRLSNKFL